MSKANPEPWSCKTLGRNVFNVEIEAKRNTGWEQSVLLTSDRHWDNPDSNWDLQKAHLDEAKDRKAPVLDIGDFFCAMQGKYDKRACKSKVRPEHQTDTYLNSLVTTAADFFRPWADRLVMVATGNHESAIKKRHEIDLIQMLVGALNAGGCNVCSGGFSGWVRFSFPGSGGRKAINLHYDHGYGGGGPVTKGVIQSNRRANYLPDADIVVSGHVHEQWVLDIQRVRLSQQGKVYHDTQTHVTLPTYKEEYKDGFGGWHCETGKPPKPIGAAWLVFYYSRRKDQILHEIRPAR